MKNLFVILTFLLTLSSCAVEKNTSYSISADKAYLLLAYNTTELELEAITKEFSTLKNIDIDYSNSTFDEHGLINYLEIHVDFNDGYSGGSCSSTRWGLWFKNVGFIRNYNDSEKKKFSIGSITI